MQILILSYSDFNRDPRVRRQIKALQGHTIITCGLHKEADFQIYAEPQPSLVRKFKRLFWLLIGQYERFYWDNYRKSLAFALRYAVCHDRIIANDIQTLPLALSISSNVYFDAHEYHPQEEQSWKWKLLYKRYTAYLCKKYIPRAQTFSTVAAGIAEKYQQFCGRKPNVVLNATEYHDLKPVATGNKIRLVHHGVAIPQRKIENMIKVMQYLDDKYTLDLYLTTIPETQWYLDMLSMEIVFNPRVIIHAPVPFDKICETLNQYDIGIYILPPTNFNNLHALPNKFFDFIQARLAIAVSPNPEMATLVRRYGLGTVASDYSTYAMAVAISGMSVSKIESYKEVSDKWARGLSAENNYMLIRENSGTMQQVSA